MKLKGQQVIRALLGLWIVVWICFLITFHLYTDRVKNYSELISLSTEERIARIVGEQFYEFVQFCQENLPAEASYKILGAEPKSLEIFRFQYYLYPHLALKDPQFILVYNIHHQSEPGYSLYKTLNDENYILKKDPQ